jgi:hypothetical protein
VLALPREECTKYTIEMVSDGVTHMPNFTNIGCGTGKLLGEEGFHSDTGT